MGAVTLTPQQFAKTGAARQGGTYQKYLSFVARRRGGNSNGGMVGGASDPYGGLINTAPQPFTPQQIQQQIHGYTSGLPAPLTGAQIQQRAQAEISPLIAAITQSIQGQAQRSSQAVTGYTQALADQLSHIDFGAPYTQGEQAQSATDAALHQALQDGGSQDAQDLASRLAVINDPSVAKAAAAVSDNGTGNANANLGFGTNAMSDLIANAAAAGSFGQKLPGIAQLSGLQNLATVGQNAATQIGDQTQQIESQLPGIIQALTSSSDSNATNRAQAEQQLFQYLTGVNDTRSTNLTRLQENKIARNDAISAGAAKNDAAVTVAKTRADATVTAAELRQANSDRSYQLQLAKAIGYDPVTNKPLPGYKWQDGQVGGTIVKNGTGANGQKQPQLTAVQIQKYKGTAATIAENTYKGFTTTDKAGNVAKHPPIGYQAAIEEARKEGVPLSIFIPYLNMWFKPGERGRPAKARPDTNPRTNPNAAGPPAPR